MTPSVYDVVRGQINKEITPSHAFDRDSLEVSLHRSSPDHRLVIHVPHFGDDIQSQDVVRIHVRRIAIYQGAVAQVREEMVNGRQVGFMNQEVGITQRSRAQDAIETGDQIGALEQDAVDTLLLHLAQDSPQLFKFDLVPGADAGIVREVSLNVGGLHASAVRSALRSKTRSRTFQYRRMEPETRNLPDR